MKWFSPVGCAAKGRGFPPGYHGCARAGLRAGPINVYTLSLGTIGTPGDPQIDWAVKWAPVQTSFFRIGVIVARTKSFNLPTTATMYRRI